MNIWLHVYTCSFIYSGCDVIVKFVLICHMEKYFHELLQILVNFDENLRINTYKDLSFLLHMLVRSFPWMGTSDMLVDNEFGFDLLDS